jgi:hypothetical protein
MVLFKRNIVAAMLVQVWLEVFSPSFVSAVEGEEAGQNGKRRRLRGFQMDFSGHDLQEAASSRLRAGWHFGCTRTSRFFFENREAAEKRRTAERAARDAAKDSVTEAKRERNLKEATDATLEGGAMICSLGKLFACLNVFG